MIVMTMIMSGIATMELGVKTLLVYGTVLAGLPYHIEKERQELLGLFISGHPLMDIAPALAEATTPIADITIHNSNEKVKIGGIITTIKNRVLFML